MPQSIYCGYLVDDCTELSAIRTIKVGRGEAATSLQSNKYMTEIDNPVDKTALSSNCLPINDFEISVDVSVWDTSAGSVK